MLRGSYRARALQISLSNWQRRQFWKVVVVLDPIRTEAVTSAYCDLPPTATGSLQPYRIAIKRSPKQRSAPIVIAAADETCRTDPITTTAAPARAATA